MYPNRMHVVTVASTGIDRIEALKGRRVSTGSPGSATEVYALRMLQAAGIAEADIRRERLGVAESVNAVRDKKIDAFFWVGGVPTAAITDLAATPGTKIRLLDSLHLTAAMNAKWGAIYAQAGIPASTYPGMERDAEINAIWNLMVVNASMSEDLAYHLTRVMLEQRDALGREHKEALNIRAQSQTSSRTGIPWHPGALRYFREKDIRVVD